MKREVTLGRIVSLLGLSGALLVSMAQSPSPSATQANAGSWFMEQVNFSNIVAAAVLIYHFGFLRAQMERDRERLNKLEKFNEETLPDTYVRQDVHETQLRGIDEKLDVVVSYIRSLMPSGGLPPPGHFRSKNSGG